MNTKRLLNRLVAPALISALCAAASACNEKSEDNPEATDASVVECVAVSSFTLKANSDVMENLDSVFFSIDLEHGVIFNADSLPKGTDISKLVATITYPNTVSSAVISTIDKEYKYSENPSDSIDFSHGATLTLKAGDNLEKSYRIKVNVHQQVADTLTWDKIGVLSLPSAMKTAVRMKTVDFGGKIISFYEDAVGKFFATVYPKAGASPSETSSLGFRPGSRIETITACGDFLYMLDADGHLLSSGNHTDWTDTGLIWDNIIGAYSSTLLGLRSDNGAILHTAYPMAADFHESKIDPQFPVSGFSNTGIFTSAWAPDPTLCMVGGKTADGQLVSGTWAYDGINWTEIANRALPALQDMALVPYFAYRRPSSSVWDMTEFSVWIAIGGRDADGKTSRTVYISYDNGVNWDTAPSYMQLPENLPALYAMDAIVAETPMNSDLADNWRKIAPRKVRSARISYTINGTDISWLCPYIYLYGGFNDENALSQNIWRAVLARLTFTPIF
ncbi:MAG: DUF6242 domain-containing protein [Muribaculum sp.]|nr:DUF6242 domain-containing protein [Muribaculum sp.]